MTFALLDAPMVKEIKRFKSKDKDDQLREQLELYRQFLPLKEAVRAEYRRVKKVDFVTQGTLGLETRAYKMSEPTLKNGVIIPAQLILDKNGKPIPVKHRSERTEISSSYQKNDITDAIVKGAISREIDPHKQKQLILGNKARQKLLLFCEGIVVKLSNQRANLERNNPLWYSELATDLIQYCNLPLSYCVWHYNPISPLNGKPIKFSSFAYSWIKLGVMDYMRQLSGMTETGNARINFYTEIRDNDGSYTSIFEVNNLATSDNTIDFLIEQEDDRKKMRQHQTIKKLLTPLELEELMDERASVDIYKGTIFESLPSVSTNTKRQKIIDKVRQILD